MKNQPAQPSITSSPSFQARLLVAEVVRARLLLGIWVVALGVVALRSMLGDNAFTSLRMGGVALGVVTGAVIFQLFVLADSVRRRRLGRPRGTGPNLAIIIVDIAAPALALLLLQFRSPSGTYWALSSPALLIMPLVTCLSILRLDPKLALLSGLIAAGIHAALCVIAIVHNHIDHSHWPMMFNYAVVLAATGVAAGKITFYARTVVQEAVEESLASESRRLELAVVERDLAVARDIQTGLMPSGSPTIAGFDIAGMARPAQQTGGDYYDWQPLPGGHLAVVLADVTGHGIGPALVMAVCRAYARASAPTAPDPAELLMRVNQLIYDDLAASGRFITMVIAVISPDGRVDLCSAGHGPTLLYRAATRDVEVFGGDGPPLGIDPDLSFDAHAQLRLHPGDVLLLATDGFMEWQRASDGQQFGSARLRESLARAVNESARSIFGAIDADVQRFAEGAPQSDDTTAVVIKRL